MTLIELMIAAAVGLGVIGAALSMLVMSQKATTANEQVVETQQNVRVAMEMLARDMRLASYNYVGNVPGAPTVGTCSVTNGTFSRPVGLRPRDQNPTGADTGPDSISMVVPLLTDVVTPGLSQPMSEEQQLIRSRSMPSLLPRRLSRIWSVKG